MNARGRKCTKKVDIYSLGVIMWELLSGERPYTQEDDLLTLLDTLPGHAFKPVIKCVRQFSLQCAAWRGA